MLALAEINIVRPVDTDALPHRRIAEQEAAELAARDDVAAVLLGGSVVRGEHQPSSDVDLLVVGPESTELPVRRVVRGVLVERTSHSEAGWAARFDRPRTSWLYAFLEATVLFDDGSGRRLQQQAQAVQESYRASPELRSLLATSLWHGQAKLGRAIHGDDQVRGYWAGICVETIIDALYTVHDVPLPAGSRRMDYLHLVSLTVEERKDLAQLLTGTTQQRFEAATRLITAVRHELGPADHEANATEE